VPRTEADLGDVHLHHAVAVVGAAPLVKAPAARSLVGVQDPFDPGDGLAGQMVRLAKDFEKSIATAVAWIMIASVKLITRRLKRA